jgi:type IV secretory pathway VirB10-like protein
LEAQVSGHKVEAASRQISESLAKPSLIYVHSAVSEKPRESLSYPELVPSVLKRSLDLPAGMRLIARLHSAITSAVVSPVVATVEYNYEKDGEILVPAGTKVLGKLEQANRSGHVAVKFDVLEWPDGTTHRIDGSAQALDYGPIKGSVAGKKNIARFATRALTGVGVVASQVVGLRGGFNGPISNSALVRDRLANNIAQAGDQQMQQLAISSNIIVTVPAGTRFYVVLQKPGHLEDSDRMSYPTASSPSWTKARPQGSVSFNRAELEELRELKQEFRRLMLLSRGQTTAPSPTPDLKPNNP